MKRSKIAEAQLRRDALSIFGAAVEAAEAGNAVRNHLALHAKHIQARGVRLGAKDFDRVFLVAAGKAAVPMALAIEEILGRVLNAGLVITKHGHTGGARRLRSRVWEAAHPIPDSAGQEAAKAIEELLRQLNARDLLLLAVSGGASALLPAPASPLTLAAKQETTDLLLHAGANIHQLNTVRKHLSFLKGGRLASLAHPATVLALLLSDVVGDSIGTIGSGLAAPDPTSFADALTVVHSLGLLDRVPVEVRSHLESGASGRIAETPKPGDPIFDNVHNLVIGSNRLALTAAARRARELGYRTLILSSSLEGETREVARTHAQILREIAASGNPIKPPACILSGGETTVTVRGPGKGGRNQEFALAAALGIAGLKNVTVLSAGTDGTDGPTDAAGAFSTGSTIERAQELELSAADSLAHNDSYPFFDALDDLIRTGPTGTNVMDVHVMLAV